MAFTRFNYDEARTKKLLQESTGAGRYILNVPAPNMLVSFHDPHIRLQKWGGNLMNTHDGRHPIDIASDLDGRTRKNNNQYCDDTLYPAVRETNAYRPLYQESGITFTHETRATHPAWAYRDLEQTRWEYPHLNPQENVCKHFHNNVSTRILEKDYYVPKVPTPMN